MTEVVLRNALNEAKEKGEPGICIWPSYMKWTEHVQDMQPGCRKFEVAVAAVEAGEDTTISIENAGLISIRVLAVPVKPALADDKVFDFVMGLCNEYHLEGPIVFLPSNDICKAC